MAAKVFLHVGLPKTATTYLQTIMWSSRDQLRAEGVLLPGDERRDHLWSSRIVREDPRVGTRPERQQTAWRRLREEIEDWPGTALVSHEFFAAASTEQADRVIAELAPAEVHLVVTAREPLGLFVASWQESLKNRESEPLVSYASTVAEDDPLAVWNWRTLDLRLVLERWAPGLPPDRVHVLPLPRGSAPRDLIWERFAGLVGLEPTNYDGTSGFANSSMGVAEAEALRRINLVLTDRGLLASAPERGVMIRTYLADERLVQRDGDRFWPTPAQIEECRERGRAARDLVVSQGYDVIGAVDDLLVPDELPERRTPESVTDREVADIAADLVAQLAADVHELRRANARLQRRLDAPPPPVPTLAQRVRNRVRRTLRADEPAEPVESADEGEQVWPTA